MTDDQQRRRAARESADDYAREIAGTDEEARLKKLAEQIARDRNRAAKARRLALEVHHRRRQRRAQ